MYIINGYLVRFTKNHLIESLSTYLDTKNAYVFKDNSNTFTLSALKDFESNKTSFSVRIEFGNVKAIRNLNYVSIKNDDSSKAVTRYYFVNSVNIVSEYVADLLLELDVVNTYQRILLTQTFRDVKMKRRHKDRWSKYNETYYRVYDEVDEGLGDVACEVEYKKTIGSDSCYIATTTIPDTVDSIRVPFSLPLNKVYLEEGATKRVTTNRITDTTIGASEIYATKVFGYCTNSEDFMRLNVASNYDMSCLCNAFYLTYTATIYGTSITNGHTVLYLGTYSNGVFTPMVYHYLNDNYCNYEVTLKTIFSSGTSVIYYETNVAVKHSPVLTLNKMYSVDSLITLDAQKKLTSTVSYPVQTITSIHSVNRHDSNLQCVQDVPVMPGELDIIWMGDDVGAICKGVITERTTFDLNSLSTTEPIQYTKTLNPIVTNRVMSLESKLYGSYVRNHQLVYDTFALAIQPEYYKTDWLQELTVQVYKPTGLSNDIAFKCESISEQTLNSNVMACSRNNQIEVYSNEYLNYLRNGYNYDEKTQTVNRIKNWVNLAIGGTGVGATAALKESMGKLSAFSGIQQGANALSSLSNLVFSWIENAQALEQKRLSLINTSPTTIGSTSIDLFKDLNGGNRLKYVVTKPTDETLNSIYNLFYYYGYADNTTQSSLQLTKTRCYFDYYQGDASNSISILSQDNSTSKGLLIKALSEGITIEHYYNNTWLCEGNLYENWEVSLS